MAKSKIVFGCLKHRTVTKTVELPLDKIIWVDCCKRDNNIRIHTTELDDDLLNRRGISTLDTQITPICTNDGKSTEEGKTTEENSQASRKRSSMYVRAPSINESSETKYQKLDVYVPGQRKSRIVVRGTGVGARFTTNGTDKIADLNEFVPGERFGRNRRSSKQPSRLVCQE